MSHNARVWLATLSTVVGVATGMFTLRDEVFPGESGTAGAISVTAYRADVGEICDELNEEERARRSEERRLARELSAARRSILAQRNALLDASRRTVARSAHTLASFGAMTAPEGLGATHRSTAGAWTRNVERVRSYITRLDQVGDREELVAAVGFLSRTRPALARDGLRVNTGLERLGKDRCEIDRPVVGRSITLPPKPTPKPRDDRPEEVAPALKPAPTTAPRSAPTPAETIEPSVNVPRPSNPAPSNPRVNPPSTGGPVSGGGEDG